MLNNRDLTESKVEVKRWQNYFNRYLLNQPVYESCYISCSRYSICVVNDPQKCYNVEKTNITLESNTTSACCDCMEGYSGFTCALPHEAYTISREVTNFFYNKDYDQVSDA